MSDDDLLSGWSCDERKRAECRNGHGCHCREITALRIQVERQNKAVQMISILANTAPDGWLSKQEIYESLAEFRSPSASDGSR